MPQLVAIGTTCGFYLMGSCLSRILLRHCLEERKIRPYQLSLAVFALGDQSTAALQPASCRAVPGSVRYQRLWIRLDKSISSCYTRGQFREVLRDKIHVRLHVTSYLGK